MAADAAESEYSVKAVTQVLDRKVFAAGKKIFMEGEPGNIAYILLRGDVTIKTGLNTPNERELTKVKPGQMFGELALMAAAYRTASAVTENGCELLTVSQEKLKKKLADADPFVRYWIEYLSQRVIDLSTPQAKAGAGK